MSDIICVLLVTQGSELEKEIDDTYIVSSSYMMWEDTGTPVKYPIQANIDRKRKCVETSYHELYFNQIAQRYPARIRWVSKKDSPAWGDSWWAADAVGLIKLYKSNWDSSD